MSNVRAIGCRGNRPEDALAHLAAELADGAVGVISFVLTKGGVMKLSTCGDVPCEKLAFAGAWLLRGALEGAEGTDE